MSWRDVLEALGPDLPATEWAARIGCDVADVAPYCAPGWRDERIAQLEADRAALWGALVDAHEAAPPAAPRRGRKKV